MPAGRASCAIRAPRALPSLAPPLRGAALRPLRLAAATKAQRARPLLPPGLKAAAKVDVDRAAPPAAQGHQPTAPPPPLAAYPGTLAITDCSTGTLPTPSLPTFVPLLTMYHCDPPFLPPSPLPTYLRLPSFSPPRAHAVILRPPDHPSPPITPPTSPPLLLPSFCSNLFPPFSLQASESGLMILGATLLLTPSAIASVGVLIIALIVPMQRAIHAVDQADAFTQVAPSLRTTTLYNRLVCSIDTWTRCSSDMGPLSRGLDVSVVMKVVVTWANVRLYCMLFTWPIASPHHGSPPLRKSGA